MPFGLCTAPSTFQGCMLSIFSGLLEDCMEVFMDDFTVYADTFDACLGNLARVLKRNFIKNFSKTTLPLSNLLQEDVEFVFNKECIEAFEELKTKLTSTPILQAPNWELPFKLMCDASNSALGVELDLEIRDKKGVVNPMADHLSRIEREPDPMPIQDSFLDEQLLRMDTSTPWFIDICNFIVASQFPPEASQLYKEKIKSEAKYYI
ncbi:Retrovirus-related Pol polyprotein, partial [Mucuna pruriens]